MEKIGENEMEEVGTEAEHAVVKIEDVVLAEAIEAMDEMQTKIRNAVRAEFRKEAVKGWVRHELEELLGHVILRRIDVIVDRILDGVEKRLRFAEIKTATSKEEILRLVAQRVYNELNTEGELLKEDIEEKVEEMIKKLIKESVKEKVSMYLNDARNDVYAELKKYEHEIKARVRELIETNFGELLVKQLGIQASEISALRTHVMQLEAQIRAMKEQRVHGR